MQIHEVKTLEGNSGCKVQLYRTERSVFVRKTSSCPAYNERLEEQCRKQNFHQSSAGVCSPSVLTWGYDEGLFYFDMEYVPGHSLADLVPVMKTYDIAPLIDLLFKMLHWNEKGKRSDSAMIFHSKIISLEKNIAGKVPDEAFALLKRFDWSAVSWTPCHGDLTLDNMIYTRDGKVCLIDFLDSFCDSWMIDLSKLLQDMELHWSFRDRHISSDTALRLQIARDMIIDHLAAMENGDEKIKTVYHLLLLNVLRIWPYAKAQKNDAWLKTATEKAIELVKHI